MDEVKEDKPKKKRGRPKKENKVTIVDDTDDEKVAEKPSTEDLIAASMSNVSEENGELQEESVSDEENEINVVEWNWKGDKYLKDDNNNVYCANTHEIIGRYSPENDSIVS